MKFKFAFGIVMLLSLQILPSCSKDELENKEEEDNLPDYSENEALILPNSQHYFIADVVIDGVETKVNLQTETDNCYSGYGKGYCSNGHYEYIAEVHDNLFGPSSLRVSLGFRGVCPNCTFLDLVTEDNNLFTTPENPFIGISLNYIVKDLSIINSPDELYTTSFTPFDTNVVTDFKLIEAIVTSESSNIVEVRFSCTLLNEDGTKSVQIKNAVYRSNVGK